MYSYELTCVCSSESIIFIHIEIKAEKHYHRMRRILKIKEVFGGNILHILVRRNVLVMHLTLKDFAFHKSYKKYCIKMNTFMHNFHNIVANVAI